MSTAMISFPVDGVDRAEGTAPQGLLEVVLEWLPGTVAYSATHPTLVLWSRRRTNGFTDGPLRITARWW